METAASTGRGPNERERLAFVDWLLAFSRQDAKALGTEDWADVRERIDHIAWILVGRDAIFPAAWLKELEAKSNRPSAVHTRRRGKEVTESGSTRLRFLRERTDEPMFRARLGPLTQKGGQQLQERLRRILDALRPRSDGEVSIQYPSLPVVITGVHLMNDHQGHGFRRVYGAAWRHLRWLAIAAILEEFGEQIARCSARDCGNLFRRNRRQEYCSSRCSQRVRSHNWYQAHQAVARERRQRAYRAKAKRLSPNVRVEGRRPTWKHHATLPPKYVLNRADGRALGPGWSDSYIHQEYPKMLYRTVEGKKGRGATVQEKIVKDADEEKQYLDSKKGWQVTPPTVD
jgi:hypothetical protein